MPRPAGRPEYELPRKISRRGEKKDGAAVSTPLAELANHRNGSQAGERANGKKRHWDVPALPAPFFASGSQSPLGAGASENR